ncbi:MAG: lysine-2,3-aminomutase-like protein [Rhodospirillaceae bacterium]
MNDLSPRTLTSAADLAAAGLVAADEAAEVARVTARYAVAIPPAVHHLIRSAAQAPAIARQFVPSVEELELSPGENADPIGDHAHSPVKGIVHRYPDRVLLLPTLTCAVYCRFCFRREDVGTEGVLTPAEMDAALAYIRATPSVWEVILTGGDPLVLSARRLGEIVRALDAIPQVQVIRVHTRVPVAAPERVGSALIAALKATGKAVYVAIHCNHAEELTPAMRAACARLSDAGIPLLSQTVLLKDVNDSADALEALMRALVAARIRPYYLHQLDYAPGTGHFRVPLERGRAIVKALRGRLSGLAQPTYILDIPGGAGKVPITGAYVTEENKGSYGIEDPQGTFHAYPPRAE